MLPGMILKTYLDDRKESQNAFSRRTGLGLATVSELYQRKTIPSGYTCLVVIQASRDEPAPCGGTVTLRDLVTETLADYLQDNLPKK